MQESLWIVDKDDKCDNYDKYGARDDFPGFSDYSFGED
jgi:hypothetical protein